MVYPLVHRKTRKWSLAWSTALVSNMLQPRVSICATEEIKGSLRVGLFRMIEGRIRSFLYSLRWVDSANRLKNLKDSVQWPEVEWPLTFTTPSFTTVDRTVLTCASHIVP